MSLIEREKLINQFAGIPPESGLMYAHTFVDAVKRRPEVAVDSLPEVKRLKNEIRGLNYRLGKVRLLENTARETDDLKAVCAQAINSFGDAPQMLVAIEEMAELTQALSKSGRYGIEAARAQVLEEMADVYIMLEQLKIIFDFSAEEVQQEQAVKLEKLKKYLGSKKK